jgi:hypothetical protein
MKLLFQFFLSSMSSILKTVPAEAWHLVQRGKNNFKLIFYKNSLFKEAWQVQAKRHNKSFSNDM